MAYQPMYPTTQSMIGGNISAGAPPAAGALAQSMAQKGYSIGDPMTNLVGGGQQAAQAAVQQPMIYPFGPAANPGAASQTQTGAGLGGSTIPGATQGQQGQAGGLGSSQYPSPSMQAELNLDQAAARGPGVTSVGSAPLSVQNTQRAGGAYVPQYGSGAMAIHQPGVPVGNRQAVNTNAAMSPAAYQARAAAANTAEQQRFGGGASPQVMPALNNAASALQSMMGSRGSKGGGPGAQFPGQAGGGGGKAGAPVMTQPGHVNSPGAGLGGGDVGGQQMSAQQQAALQQMLGNAKGL